MGMDHAARRALQTMRQCIAEDRYRVLQHFAERLDERGLFWSDVLVVFDDPADVRDGGPEKWGRPKWIVAGRSAGGDELELVCVIDTDADGKLVLLVTLYEG